ncbi:fungal specific transcription factor domain-containing protein [Aspergillus melleus]|uniref:fungal specific transcription factor domain-containing protein n=1 Tax=Aspergillus melleus TaxID=138277 RepID=UPI001E8D9D90|nr:uncharacterized protein LDX57_008641 [Aspergillus melleus]KAH8430979.1 hypothetical protein LDX57_008641 [Aspergillus melleus]
MLIQSYMTRLVLVASEILAEMAECQDSSFWIHADRLAGQLDQWHQALPPELHLAALSSVDRTLTQEKALYLMHMMYIDSRLQLYCRLLEGFQNCTGGPSPQPSVHLLGSLFNQVPKHMCETYTAFSIQLARIASLLYSQEVIMTRCWLVVCAVFDVCIVLLLGICRKYFTDSSGSFTDLPAHVHTCLTVLRFCSSGDIAAHRLMDMLEPILELWNCLGSTSRVQQEGQMRIEYILDERSADIFTVVRMTYQLLDLMPQTRSNVWV